MFPSKNEIIQAASRIHPFVHQTPVLYSVTINNLTGSDTFFKCENFQKMGAFKMRGACNSILQLSKEQLKNGVVTHSSGNFAQAVSLSVRNLNTKAYIVMPANAPKIKKDAVRGYGGEIVECEPTIMAREAAVEEIINQTGAAFLHPSNNLDVIIGNATSAYELIQKTPGLDYIIAPVGGGGLLAGTALAAHYFAPGCEIIGAEPSLADDAFRSLKEGRILRPANGETIADGLRTYLGDQNFPIIGKLVKRIILIDEDEIIAAMRLIWERMKIIIEPSSAVAVAALFKENFQNKKVGIIISGGNVDLSNLPFIQQTSFQNKMERR